MKLLVTIVQRGKGEEVAKLVSSYQVDYHVIFLGQGTATSSMLDYFSLTNTDKDVVFSLINKADEEAILERLDSEYEFLKKPMGMAFTISLTSINRLAFEKLTHQKEG